MLVHSLEDKSAGERRRKDLVSGLGRQTTHVYRTWNIPMLMILLGTWLGSQQLRERYCTWVERKLVSRWAYSENHCNLCLNACRWLLGERFYWSNLGKSSPLLQANVQTWMPSHDELSEHQSHRLLILGVTYFHSARNQSSSPISSLLCSICVTIPETRIDECNRTKENRRYLPNTWWFQRSHHTSCVKFLHHQEELRSWAESFAETAHIWRRHH